MKFVELTRTGGEKLVVNVSKINEMRTTQQTDGEFCTLINLDSGDEVVKETVEEIMHKIGETL